MKSWVRWTFCVAVLAGLPVLRSLNRGFDQTRAEPPASPTVEASPAPPAVRRPEAACSAEPADRLEGCEQARVAARVSGLVHRVHVKIGDPVRAGQLLAELAVPDLRDELRQREAKVLLARAEIDQARRALTAAEANLRRAQAAVAQSRAAHARAESNLARSKAEYERTRKLLLSRAAATETGEQALDHYRSATALCEETQANIDLVTAARDESRALRDQAEANLHVADAKQQVAEADRQRTAGQLAFAEIRAPFDGVITDRQAEAGQAVDTAEVLFTVVKTDAVRLCVHVAEADAMRVATGTAARVRVAAWPSQPFEGRVSHSSWALDPQTHTLRAWVELPNPDGRLRPGMRAEAQLLFPTQPRP